MARIGDGDADHAIALLVEGTQLAIERGIEGFARWRLLDVAPLGTARPGVENLGRLYADKHGLEVVCVRIGTFADRPTTPRHLSTWLSPRDAVELFYRCLVAPDVGFTMVYGASANRRGWWDLGPAERLGYRPVDDAERWALEIDAAAADPNESGKGPQGGSYARETR